MRRFLKIILAILGVVVLIILCSWFYLFHMHGLENIISGQLNSAIATYVPLRVSIGAIRGDFLQELILEDVVVRYDDSAGGGDLFKASRITASYKLSNLLNKSYMFRYVWFDSAAVMLSQDSTGKILLPVVRMPASQPSSIGSSSDSAGVPDIAIDNLLLNQCTVTLVRGLDSLRFYNIAWNSAVKVEGGTISADIRQASVQSNRPEFAVPGMSGKLTYASGVLATRDLAVIRDDGKLRLSGSADLTRRTAQFAFNIDEADLAKIGKLFGIGLSGQVDAYGNVTIGNGEISGNASLGGQFLMADLQNLSIDFRFRDGQLFLDTLRGIALDNCSLDGSAQFDLRKKPETYSATLSLANFNLVKLVPTAIESNLNGSIQLAGESFKDATLKLQIDADLYESTFGGYPIQSGAGRMIVTADSISFPDTFKVSYFENEFDIVGMVEYSRDILLNVKAHLANLDRYRGRLFLNQPGGRGYAEATLSGKTSDPDLEGFFTSDSVWLYGLYAKECEIGFHVSRFLTGRRGEVHVRMQTGGIWNVPYDTLSAVLGLDSNIVRVDTLFAISPKASVSAKGEVLPDIYPQQITVDSLVLHTYDQTLVNRGLLQISLDSVGLEFRKAAVTSRSTMLMALGRINFDESMNLALSVNNVPLGSWARLVEENFHSDGLASFQADLTGTFRNPIFTLRASVDSLTYDSLTLGDLSIAGAYRQQTFTLDSLLLESHPGRYTARGKIDVDIDFTSDSLLKLIDQPLDMTISASDQRFDLVSLVLPSVESMQGDFHADFRLFGKPSEPHLQGEAYLKNGRLKYFDLTNELYTDSAGVTMKDNQIIIDKIECYVKNTRHGSGKSLAIVDGTITVKSFSILNYDLDVQLPREFPIWYELEDIQGVAEGSVHIEGDTPPLVTGDITVTSARYRVNFASPGEGSPLMELLSGDQTWDFNVNVDILSNYWIQNDDIDAEFAGNLNIIRERGVYRFIGEMDILQGKGFLFDKVFRIDPGSKVLFNNVDTLNPTLDITATTRIVGLSSSTDQSKENIDLGLHITGTLEAPEFSTTGENFSSEDILPLLVANYSASDTGQAKAMTKIEQRLTGLVSSQMSQIGTRQLRRLGVETFDIDPTYGGTVDPLKSVVTLGFYTNPSLYVYGRSALSGRLGQEVGFEYRFNKSFLLQGKRDENELYHLNLQLHWEF